MLAKTKINKEKSILLSMFVLMFCISLVLILFERTKINLQLAQIEAQKQSKLEKFVLGTQAISGYEITEYHDVIALSFAQINSTINRYKATGVLSKKEAENAYALLLEARVPRIYQDLHFKLTQLAQEILKDKTDIRSVLLESDFLYKEFPWLRELIIK
jgi:hypothetical protein|tara:strand:- start:2837 stop:3313 length:477 start_codon:yes stop_codon:yes gene_type:complete